MARPGDDDDDSELAELIHQLCQSQANLVLDLFIWVVQSEGSGGVAASFYAGCFEMLHR